jgi:hypothetical protein
MEETGTSAPIMQEIGIFALVRQKTITESSDPGYARDRKLCSRLPKRQESIVLDTSA